MYVCISHIRYSILPGKTKPRLLQGSGHTHYWISYLVPSTASRNTHSCLGFFNAFPPEGFDPVDDSKRRPHTLSAAHAFGRRISSIILRAFAFYERSGIVGAETGSLSTVHVCWSARCAAEIFLSSPGCEWCTARTCHVQFLRDPPSPPAPTPVPARPRYRVISLYPSAVASDRGRLFTPTSSRHPNWLFVRAQPAASGDDIHGKDNHGKVGSISAGRQWNRLTPHGSLTFRVCSRASRNVSQHRCSVGNLMIAKVSPV